MSLDLETIQTLRIITARLCIGCRIVNDLVEKDSASIVLSIITTFHVLRCNITYEAVRSRLTRLSRTRDGTRPAGPLALSLTRHGYGPAVPVLSRLLDGRPRIRDGFMP